MKRRHRSTLLAAALLFAGAANADDFICGTHIIEEGLTKAEVLQRCGAPASQYGAHWVYDFGPEKFKVLLHFGGDDKVERIEQELQSND